MRKGDISISTENIFPIIKKWLYSDCDIFLRELVSNGCDAITKLKKLSAIGEASINSEEVFAINILLNKDEKTLTISDNGIGMTEDEVVKYITQIAFSGAEEFIQQYKEKSEGDAGIIGHFGLGFYSAFMVAERVDIHTRSYIEDASGVFWSCDGSMNYEISEDAKKNRGTEIVLHIADEMLEERIQFVVLGTGEPEYEDAFRSLEKKHTNLRALIKFDRVISKRMYASADLFLMPSKSEPCGLAQMICCSYGTIPLVRSVGGLYDSIIPYGDEGSNGFRFDNYNAHELLYAVKKAIEVYNNTAEWEALRKRAIASDFTWQKSAEKYMQIYNNLLNW